MIKREITLLFVLQKFGKFLGAINARLVSSNPSSSTFMKTMDKLMERKKNQFHHLLVVDFKKFIIINYQEAFFFFFLQLKIIDVLAIENREKKYFRNDNWTKPP